MKCPVCNKELKSSRCFTCEYWEKFYKDLKKDPERYIVIDGVGYTIGDEDSPSYFRGFGGDKFQIIRNNGEKIVSTNLWCSGDIPEGHWRELLPDTARFKNNLKWEDINGVKYLINYGNSESK